MTASPTAPVDPSSVFRWQDGERLIVYGRGTRADAGSLFGSGYALLSTPRAAAAMPELAAAAGSVHEVGAGRVDELAAELRPRLDAELLVALGGGRVIDVAKALAAADPPRRVAALPTTLSGAEMTVVHRHAAGVAPETPRVRPAIVINDPALSASQPAANLAASAANAFGHAAEGPLTPLSSPVPALAALEAARLIARAFSNPDRPDRNALALGALLAGYVIGSTGYGLHHVIAQTLVRFAGLGHGQANAIMLPHTINALARRSPEWVSALGDAVGEDASVFAARLAALQGGRRLREAGVEESALEGLAEQASSRAELQMTPPAADQDELAELLRAAL